MKLFALDPLTKRAILVALCVVPENVRRVALEKVSFFSTGRKTAGMAIPPVAGGDWLVVLAERGDAAVSTTAHEIAHCFLGHERGTEQAEREVCELVRSWGFRGGPSADGDVAARMFHEARPAPARPLALIRDGVVRIACQCGADCEVLAPVVPGLAAEIGIWCGRCDSCEVESIAEVVPCPSCGANAVVTWTPDATPASPEARWACTCGVTTLLRLCTDPDAEPALESPPGPPVPDDVWPLAQAARRLAGIEASLRRLEAAVQAGETPDALESCRSGIVWTRSLLLRSARELPEDDPLRAAVEEAGGELALAAERLGQRDLAASADFAAHAAAILDALVAADRAAGGSDGQA